MIKLKPSKDILWVWRIRLALICLIPSILTGWLFRTYSKLWIISTAIWIIFFTFFYVFYFPVKYKKLYYYRDGNIFVKNYGVIYTMTKSIPLKNIQFIVKKATPLEKLFKIYSYRIIGAGSQLTASGLKFDELDFLYDYIRSNK